MTGLGKMFMADHKVLIGTFDKGILCGFGIQICLDRIYVGFYLNGRI